ncbi:hypothetical protein TrCOL_g4659 [Triparma columacea]|uniref:Protein kinase domain-containing protein n=1 Tax=Triparma columacea TaxID=722753 RepID=A0A9W7GLN3_9STRA|nr:hypothetical protein TrCOL_g4659 [Triparma columacea]
MNRGQERTHNAGGTVFRIDRRYSELKAIGKGSYGVVASAVDAITQQKVAIKKISPMAAHSQDAKHVLREVRLMRYLGVHDNIITLKNLSMREQDDELYIVMELLDSDLHRIIQSSQGLSDAHHRYFMHQLLRGVNYLHKHNVIHRDLKPGNLLVTRNCELRITDFGLARLKPTREGEGGEEIEEAMTEHVVTRWYRPPELMLCPDGLYTASVDMWSVGCIFAELLGRKPLFPGKNFVHQLTLIFDVIGSPRPSQVSHIKSRQAKKFLASVQGKTPVDFETLYPSCNPVAVDLLKKLLKFEPSERLDAAAALAHPYFDALRASNKTPDPPVSIDFEFDFESQNLSRGRLKALVIEEVKGVQRSRKKAAPAVSSSAATAAAVAKREKEKEREDRKAREFAREEREKKKEEARAAAAAAEKEAERDALRLARRTAASVSPTKEEPTPKVRGARGGAKKANAVVREDSSSDDDSSDGNEDTHVRGCTNDENKLPARSNNSSKSNVPPPIPKRPERKVREEGDAEARRKPRYSEEAMRIAQGRPPVAEQERKGRIKSSFMNPTKSNVRANAHRAATSSAVGRGTNQDLLLKRHRSRSRSAGGSTEQVMAGHGLYGGPVGRPVKATRGAIPTGTDIEAVAMAAANAIAAGRAANKNVLKSAAEKRKSKGVTVPKSPKFSVMNWQKKERGARGTGVGQKRVENRVFR